MPDHPWNDDERLLADLGDALRVQDLVEVGKRSYTWRTVDAELAALTYDSLRDVEPAAATRAETATLRALTFGSASLIIELEVTVDGIVGQLVPPQGGRVRVEDASGNVLATVPVEEDGFFAIRPRPSVAFRLFCEPAASRATFTTMITL